MIALYDTNFKLDAHNQNFHSFWLYLTTATCRHIIIIEICNPKRFVDPLLNSFNVHIRIIPSNGLSGWKNSLWF